MGSLETIFRDIGAGLKEGLESRGITVGDSGFKTTLLKILNLIDSKQDKLTAGNNVTISNNVISANFHPTVVNEELIMQSDATVVNEELIL